MSTRDEPRRRTSPAAQRVISTVLPSAAPSAGVARRFVGAALQRWQVAPPVIETAVLLTSELVTNAYLHEASESELTVRRRADCLRVEVKDTGCGTVEMNAPDVECPEGRGLSIVSALADRWGSAPLRNGKKVWFELALAPAI
jgi:anti-sigma regulatory factor (Ser/Thr protein kinase)